MSSIWSHHGLKASSASENFRALNKPSDIVDVIVNTEQSRESDDKRLINCLKLLSSTFNKVGGNYSNLILAGNKKRIGNVVENIYFM